MPKMTKGDELIQAMREAVNYTKGQQEGSVTYEIKVPDKIDVAKIRKKTGLSRSLFAERFGFRPKTLQHWEQGDRKPSGPARILLAILEKDPGIVDKYLGVYRHTSKRRGHRGEKKAAS